MKHLFQKGQSGNPAGRIKADGIPHLVAQKRLLESIEILHKISIDDNTNIDERLKAVDKLAELARKPSKKGA